MWRSITIRTFTGLYILSIVINILLSSASAFLFRVDQFTDVTEKCKSDKEVSYILNEDKPSMYVSIDPNKPKNYKKKRREVLRNEEIIKKYTMKASNENAMKVLKNFQKGMDKDLLRNAKIIFRKIMKNYKNNIKRPSSIYANKTFDCSIQFETELPKGDKTNGKYDALSLIIVELSHNAEYPMPGEYPNLSMGDNGINKFGDTNAKNSFQRLFNFGLVPNSRVEVVTSGKNGRTYKNVTKRAQYSERIWPGHNPNFLLSGQLSGFDSIDYRTKIDPQVNTYLED